MSPSAGGSGELGWGAPAAEWLARRTSETPRATAIVYAGRASDYAALSASVARLEAALAERGLCRGHVVAMAIDEPLLVAWVAHAVARLGATLLPLNTRLSARELDFELRDAQPDLVLTDRPRAELSAERRRLELSLSATGDPVLLDPDPDTNADTNADTHADTHADREALAPRSGPRAGDDALLWLYTSGTSGRPKAVELSEQAILASARGHAQLLGLEARDRWLACMPFFHIGGLSILWRSVLAGSSIELHAGFDAERVARALSSGEISAVSLVPTMLQRVLSTGLERTPSALRYILLGGAAAPEALLERAAALGLPVAPTYGLTEAASQVATRRPGDTRKPLSAGLVALPGSELRVRRADGSPAAPDELGEVEVRSATLMSCYVDRAAETREALVAGWLRTGDIGALAADGRLRIELRRTDLIVSGGENIDPREVEALLLQHESVRECAVVAVADDAQGDEAAGFGERPFAFLVGGPAVGLDALRDYCRGRLAGYKLPVGVEWIDALPRTASGKLKRAELRARLADARR